MMLTEEQAKERWCPHARVPCYEAAPTETEGPAAANRAPIASSNANMIQHERMEKATRCIGSACMAWRFVRMAIPRLLSPQLTQADTDAMLATDRRTMTVVEFRPGEDLPATEVRPLLGYCGLAGKP